MTTTCLDDTLPLPSDDEKTYYGSDLSFSEESEEGSIQLLYKIINLENSRSLYSEAPNIHIEFSKLIILYRSWIEPPSDSSLSDRSALKIKKNVLWIWPVILHITPYRLTYNSENDKNKKYYLPPCHFYSIILWA